MPVLTEIYEPSTAVSKHLCDRQDVLLGSDSVLFVHSEHPVGGLRVQGMLDWASKSIHSLIYML